MTNTPTRIGNYTLERRIGKGGSSEVWLARHQSLENRPVAIKLLLSQDHEWIKRFTLEAAITSRLRHNNIIQIFDHGYQGTHYYTSMEYVSGGALRDVFRTTPKLSLDQALHIFRSAGAALDYAHANGIIHRDVSPGNILVEAGGTRVLLTDFGIAREAGKAGITTVSAVMGTPGYLSPEHAISATAVTHLSDIYSLGIVLFEMLTGNMPWEHTPGMTDGSGGPFVPPVSLRAAGVTNLPSGVDRVLQTMMAVDPTKRYPSVQLAIEDLDRVLKTHTATTQVVGGSSAGEATLATTGVVATGRTITIAQPVELHPVETVLGPDLLKGPMQEARKHADALSEPQELVALLNRWSEGGRMRRRLLGRQAAIHRITHNNAYFYKLHVLYETRTPLQVTSEPDHKAAQFALEKELGRWEMPLPIPKGFVDEAGGTVRIPGSVRVANCQACAGLARLPCQRCKGKGRIAVLRDVPVSGANPAKATESTTRSTTATATAPPKAETVIACPECNGTGGIKCEACDGVGRMLEQKTTTWSRRAAEFRGNDDLPNVDETWLAKTCQPSEIYRERQTGGIRADWKSIPEVAELIKEANDGLVEDTTRIAMSELVVSFIPVAELVFDLGEKVRGKAQPAPVKTKGAPPPPPQQDVVNTYNMHIYGFGRSIPNDWRFLNWDRVWVLLLAGLAIALLLLLVVVLVTG